MNSIQSLAALIAGSGLLISLLAIPLILRCIPPNALYGVRTKASFASDSDWYRINAIGGRYLALSGIVILGVGIIGFFLPIPFFDTYSISATAATLLSVIIPCIRLCFLKPSTSSHDNGQIA
ncbi:MAG: SdpI family protein [Verrucomicrobiota bacterium]